MIFRCLFLLCCVLAPAISHARTGPQTLSTATVAETLSDDGVIIDELALKDVDILEALEMIAEKGRLNIVTGKGVDGQVTLFVKHVKARDALRMILEANGLAFVEKAGMIRVMTAEDYAGKYGHNFGQEMVTRVIRLNFMPVEDVVDLFAEMRGPHGRIVPNEDDKSVILIDRADRVRAMEALIRELDVQTVTVVLPIRFMRAENVLDKVRSLVTQSVGRIECDIAKNTIILTDALPNVERIRRMAEAMDAHSRKIVLEARLVHIVLNDDNLGGVDWEGIVSDYQIFRLEGGYDFLNNEDGGNVLSLGIIDNEDLSTLIDALDTVGLVKEYPFSDIAVTMEDQAEVAVKMDDPYLMLGAVGLQDDVPAVSNADGPTVEFWVKPVVEPDGTIETTIRAKETAGASRQGRAMVVHVDPGQTIVLGHLIGTEKVATRRKIPLMGDLPLLGFAFRYHNSSVRREEFAVLLTPRVVSSLEEQGAPAAAEEEALIPSMEK